MTDNSAVKPCPACGAGLSAGQAACSTCGEPLTEADVHYIRLMSGQILTFTAEEMEARRQEAEAYLARREEEHARMSAHARKMMEAQALEYAGDLATAIPLYEAVCGDDWIDPAPFKRLAIVYRREKRFADEERVIRAAIAKFGGTRQSWFVLRLAKIIGKRREAP